jgi:putative Mg2+ transporter-C (MgtC) family protein
MSILEIILKLLLAVGLGGIVGIERETSHKPAGFRTNVLICVGSTMMMILAGLVLQEKEASGDVLSRIAAGVITGIGFIGAGTIIQAQGSVVGLTTAATLWVVAGLGLVIGAGYYWEAIIFTAVIILTLVIFRQLEGHFLKKTLCRYQIKTKHSEDILNTIKSLAIHEGLRFDDLSLRKEGDSCCVDFSFHASDEKIRKFNESLLKLEDTIEIKIV